MLRGMVRTVAFVFNVSRTAWSPTKRVDLGRAEVNVRQMHPSNQIAKDGCVLSWSDSSS